MTHVTPAIDNIANHCLQVVCRLLVPVKFSRRLYRTGNRGKELFFFKHRILLNQDEDSRPVGSRTGVVA
jgi:hypothetical protein